MRLRRIFLVTMLTFASILVSCQNSETGQNELILIPAGPFLMGENSGRASNQPRREVYLDAYYIQKSEVTSSHFVEFLAATNLSGHRLAGSQNNQRRLASNRSVLAGCRCLLRLVGSAASHRG